MLPLASSHTGDSNSLYQNDFYFIFFCRYFWNKTATTATFPDKNLICKSVKQGAPAQRATNLSRKTQNKNGNFLKE